MFKQVTTEIRRNLWVYEKYPMHVHICRCNCNTRMVHCCTANFSSLYIANSSINFSILQGVFLQLVTCISYFFSWLFGVVFSAYADTIDNYFQKYTKMCTKVGGVKDIERWPSTLYMEYKRIQASFPILVRCLIILTLPNYWITRLELSCLIAGSKSRSSIIHQQHCFETSLSLHFHPKDICIITINFVR